MNKVIKIKDYKKKKEFEKLLDEKVVVIFPTLKYEAKIDGWNLVIKNNTKENPTT